MQLGVSNEGWPMTLGPPKHVEAKVNDAATVGFKADDGELILLFATPDKAEIRAYRAGIRKTLATYPGAKQIACDDVGDTLRFSIDGRSVFSYPKGKAVWSAYCDSA